MLWGIRLVRTGVMRAFGGSLRQFLGMVAGNRFSSFGVGAMVTVLLQSSTATVMIVSTFAAKGLLQVSMALAVMLGADLGTSISAQILSFDLSWAAYLLIFLGFVTHSKTAGSRRQIGRAFLGLGLVLLALSLIRMASAPLKESELLVEILTALESETLLTLFLMAGLTWLMHSSLAMVLLTTTLSASGVVPVNLGILMVLGANLGGTIPPIIATLEGGIEGRRVAIGNALFKLAGCLILLPFLPLIVAEITSIPMLEQDARLLVHVHLAFNFFVALMFLPLVGRAASLLEKLFPKPETDDENGIRYLKEEFQGSPTMALASASHELHRVTGQIEESLEMLKQSVAIEDQALISRMRHNHKTVLDTLEALKFFMTNVMKEEISEGDSNRAMNILLFSTNLGHVAEITDNAVDMCETRMKQQLRFSKDGINELLKMLDLIQQGLRLVLSAALQGDERVRKTIKDNRKELEKLVDESRQAHFLRLREGTGSAISTSALHNELLRDLSRIFHHIHTASRIEI